MSTEIAATILQQLGSNKFKAMTGAKNFFSCDDNRALSFQLPSRFAAKGINYVKITLDPCDTYSMFFGKIAKRAVKEVAAYTDIYCDMLQAIFTRETGLDTHL